MMAQLMGAGSAVIVSGDNNDRHTIPNDIAAKHSVVFAAHGLGELDEVRVKDVRREDLNLLVKFVEEVSAVEQAQQWIVLELGQRPDTGRIQRLLSGALELRMLTFMVAIMLYVPCPAYGRTITTLDNLKNQDPARHPSFVSMKSDNIAVLCPLCNEMTGSSQIAFRRLRCGDLFHKECIDNWIRGRYICPVCKMEVRAWAEVLSDGGNFEIFQDDMAWIAHQWGVPLPPN
ncbi:RING-type domain-containing protein [Plasmodiophora brassicae]